MSKKNVQQRINSTNRTYRKNSRNKPIMFILPIAIVFVLIVATVVVLGNSDDSFSPNEVVVSENNVGSIVESQEKNDNIATGSYEVNMNYDWIVDASTGASDNAYVGNSVNNTSTVFTTITLNSTGETIYKSPYVAVGKHIENITLDKTPDKGVHEATMTYHLVDGNFDEFSSVSVAITLTVQ